MPSDKKKSKPKPKEAYTHKLIDVLIDEIECCILRGDVTAQSLPFSILTSTDVFYAAGFKYHRMMRDEAGYKSLLEKLEQDLKRLSAVSPIKEKLQTLLILRKDGFDYSSIYMARGARRE